MAELARRSALVPTLWQVQLAEFSLTLTSPDRKKILKIDAEKNYTMDIRKPDGTYKSTRFPCKTVDEAWSMAFQAVKVHRCEYAVH